MATVPLVTPEDRLTDCCRLWKVQEMAVSSSALREDFGTESDIDTLVLCDADAR